MIERFMSQPCHNVCVDLPDKSARVVILPKTMAPQREDAAKEGKLSFGRRLAVSGAWKDNSPPG